MIIDTEKEQKQQYEKSLPKIKKVKKVSISKFKVLQLKATLHKD